MLTALPLPAVVRRGILTPARGVDVGITTVYLSQKRTKRELDRSKKGWPNRYPRAMTIALGIMAREGFVLAADSEISTSGQGVDFSASHNKVFPFYDSEGGVMIITGSGSMFHVEALTAQIGKVFKDSTNETLTDLEITFQELLDKFYDDHIIPFRPHIEDVALIIAARRKNEWKRWESSLNCLRDWKIVYTATGVGEMPARSIMGPLMHGCDFESAKIMAAYVIWIMKKRIVGCGHGTSIAALKGNDPSPTGFTPLQISNLEQVFEEWSWVEGSILSYIFGSGSVGAQQQFVHGAIEQLRDRCKEILA